MTEITPAEVRELLAKARDAERESRLVMRARRAEILEARAWLAGERLRKGMDTDAAILARLRANGTAGTVRAICRDLRVSPKRVVRLRALLVARP
jgi:hypothetical protein